MMGRSYSRVRRGMVFWYNIDASVDKFNVPKIDLDGKSYHDHLLYGKRPWVIVSSDDICRKNDIVSMVPILITADNKYLKDNRHVYLKFKDKESVIITEQIRSVNSIELQEYVCMLEDDFMEEVDMVLMETLGLGYTRNILKGTGTLESLESIIMGIVEKRVEDATSKLSKVDNVDIDDAAIRIGESLQDLFDVSLEDKVREKNVEVVEEMPLNIVEPKKKKYNSKNVAVVKCSGTKRDMSIDIVRSADEKYHKWSECEMIGFLHDWEIYDADTLMRKYGCDSHKSLGQLKYRIMKKMGGNV